MPPVPVIQPNGPRIREIRVQHGYSVTAFARKIGRHRQTIWDVEGKGLPVGDVLMNQIANALGVDISEITAPGDQDDRSAPPAQAGAAIALPSTDDPAAPERTAGAA